jgi:hypothetical protein
MSLPAKIPSPAHEAIHGNKTAAATIKRSRQIDDDRLPNIVHLLY